MPVLSSLLPMLRLVALDANGAPMGGALLYTYAAGGTTNLATYSDAALTVQNANPVVANSAGVFGPIYLTSAAYRFDLKSAAGVTYYTQDNVVSNGLPISGGTLLGDLLFTDALYDIGKTGATRPRDGFFSRNVTVGGTLGVTGLSTVAALTASGTVTPQGLVDASGASAGQVKFPSTQNASANANTLDDYSEGTWTPVIGGVGGTSGQTYSFQVGSFIKIGKLVQVQGFVQLSVKGTITGNLQLQGLPFTADNALATNYCTLSISNFQGLATAVVFFGGVLTSGTAVGLHMTTVAATTITAMTTTDVGATMGFAFNMQYRANA